MLKFRSWTWVVSTSGYRRLIGRRLIFDADPVCGGFGSGQFIAPLYLCEAHAVQAVSVVLRGVGALEFFHANADGGSGLQ